MATSKDQRYQKLLHMLSDKPPVTCRSEEVDFPKVGLPMYKNFFARVIHDAFSSAECAALLQSAQDFHKWDTALVNIGNGKQALYTDVRLCDRILWDDATIAAKILDRVLPHLPENIKVLQNNALVTGNGPVKWEETWKISRLNERLRFLKYTKGCYFKPHCDANYSTPKNEETTYITVHVYLNGGDEVEANDRGSSTDDDDAAKPLIGGATRFMGLNEKDVWDFNPKLGSIVVFQHRNLLHSGEDVVQGTKYTLRSDILYRKVEGDV